MGLFKKLFGGSTASLAPMKLGKLTQEFSFTRPIYETNIAVAYAAEDKKTGQKLTLWTFRFPISPVSPESAMAVKETQNILASGLRMATLLGMGMDQDGKVFYVTQPLSAEPLINKRSERHRLGYYLLQATAQLAVVHKSGTALGSVGKDSLLVEKNGHLALNGVLPAIAHVAKKLGAKVQHAASYSAPEVRAGGAPTPQSDVFSLGAYAYRMVTGHDLPFNLDEQGHYSHLKAQLPVICRDTAEANLSWLHPVLDRSLSWRQKDRYQNADEMCAEISASCPDLGVFKGRSRASVLDSFASEYLFSPFFKIGAIACCAILVGIVVAERARQYSSVNAPVTAELPKYSGLNDTTSSAAVGSSFASLKGNTSGFGSTAASKWDQIKASIDEGRKMAGDSKTDWSDKLYFGKGAITEEKLPQRSFPVRQATATQTQAPPARPAPTATPAPRVISTPAPTAIPRDNKLAASAFGSRPTRINTDTSRPTRSPTTRPTAAPPTMAQQTAEPVAIKTAARKQQQYHWWQDANGPLPLVIRYGRVYWTTYPVCRR